MSPQTFRTITRDGRKAAPAARSRGRASTVLRHEMTVVASSVTDVVTSAGGWLYDRRMAGWRVNVLVDDRAGERALRILGADVFDLTGNLETISDDPDRVATLAVAADVYAADRRVRRFVSTSDPVRADVALWGDTAALVGSVSPVTYRLSAAARAFKAQALVAADVSAEPVKATEALYRRGATALASVSARP
jgi:hypothetical protein